MKKPSRQEILAVVTHPSDWPLDVPGVRLVQARAYLMSSEFSEMRRAKVFNLCRHYRYQTLGYYVSLLAEARGHKPIPTVLTMLDLRSPAVVRLASDELIELIQHSLHDLQSDNFVLSIYFGRNTAKRHERLAQSLFKLFPGPFLRATFQRSDNWALQSITAIPTSAIPAEHREFAFDAAEAFFHRSDMRAHKPRSYRYDLAILYDPDDPTSPSNFKAVERFSRAAEDLGFYVEVIGKDDYGRIAEFDALFIRTTTAVNHYTYRFSRRAAAEGLVVLDDPMSILRCTNKVYLAELLAHNDIPTPRTRMLHKENVVDVMNDIGFPCILKQPDSTFSLGVTKVEDEETMRSETLRLLEKSDLIIAQEFMPTEFDWRIGIIDRRPLFAAKYFMAENHWQIIRHDRSTGTMDYGNAEVLPVEEVPTEGMRLALKATNLIGDGLYGVDLKQVGKKWYVIEVNDNPSFDYHVEDRILKDELYRRIMGVFLRRVEERKGRGWLG